MTDTGVRPSRCGRRGRKRQRRGGLYRQIPILAALVAVLLAVKGGLALLGWPPGGRTAAADVPEWITQELLPVNPYSRPGTPLEQVNGIVVHYVGNPGTTAGQNRSYFAGLAQQSQEPYTSASSHFLVGLEGEIIQCVPLDEISYCSSQRNADTIAIECCHPDDTGQFNQATYQSLVRLVVWLMEEYGLDTDQVIRHYDVTGKECPRYYVQHPEAWQGFLEDVKAAL